MSDVVLRVDSLSKKFCRNLKHSMIYAFSDLLGNSLGRTVRNDFLRTSEFWALKDISFELKRGESLGLVGVNGSGKSTLLRLIAGLYPPDLGKVEVKGSVASLIAVGAGFHPHLTGRENIYLNGSILGLSKDFIRKNIDNIVDFAGVGNFLDAPVSTYSSGMRVRLGFSIASSSNPDLLLLDEVLAVGDRDFRVKCLNRIAKLQKDSAVIFVSHSLEQVARACNRAILLKDGRLESQGDVTGILDKYLLMSKSEMSSELYLLPEIKNFFSEVMGKELTISYNKNLTFSVKFDSSKVYTKSLVRMVFYSESLTAVGEYRLEGTSPVSLGLNQYSVDLREVRLRDGIYSGTLVITGDVETECLVVMDNFIKLTVKNGKSGNVCYQI